MSNNTEVIVKDILSASDLDALEAMRVKHLGRKSKVVIELRGLKDLPQEKRGKIGAELNKFKNALEQAIEIRKERLLVEEVNATAAFARDFTRPGIPAPLGHLHPVMTMMDDLIDFFRSLGFRVAEGPELETEWYCFEALNIPKDHPARDMQDTFYLEDGRVPRTHTSSVQIRHMENTQPPIRIIAPGRVYRNEDEDATHLWAFNQLEGLVVDEGINLGDLKGVLLAMARHLFGDDVEIRLRPNYFPYVEPALEMDIRYSYEVKHGTHTKREKSNWLELLGSGMVHPQVLTNCDIDPTKYSGFAFGVGVERLVAIRHELDDIRVLWRPDLKFMEQF